MNNMIYKVIDFVILVFLIVMSLIILMPIYLFTKSSFLLYNVFSSIHPLD